MSGAILKFRPRATGGGAIGLVRNDFWQRENCARCGAFDRPGTPAWVFVEGGPLCERCAERHAPTLLRYALAVSVLYYDGGEDSIVDLLPVCRAAPFPPVPDLLISYLDSAPVRDRVAALLAANAPVPDDRPLEDLFKERAP